MQITVKTNGKLTADERGELKESEVSGVLIAHQGIHEEVVSEFLESCSRNARNAVVLDTGQGASPMIQVCARSLKDYFELLKRCKVLCQIETANPYLGLIVAFADASLAQVIATKLAAFNSGGYTAALPSDLSAVSVDILAEWFVCLPISLENYALLQLLQAGKIRGEREIRDGQAVVVFRSSGSIEALDSFFRKWPGVEAAIVELFAHGGLEFCMATRNGTPAILWRCTSTVMEEAFRMTDSPNPTRQ